MEIDFGKGDFVWISLLVVLISVGFVVAYNSDWGNNPGDPAVMGHSPDELGFDVYRFLRDDVDGSAMEDYHLVYPDGTEYMLDYSLCSSGSWCCSGGNDEICLYRNDSGMGILEMGLSGEDYDVGCWLVHREDDSIKEWFVGMDTGGEECERGVGRGGCFRVGNSGEATPLIANEDALAFVCM